MKTHQSTAGIFQKEMYFSIKIIPMRHQLLLLLLMLFLNAPAFSQTFSKQDTLQGSITPEREWWDLNYYHLDIQVDVSKKYLEGTNTIRYTVLKPKQVMQIDLQEPLTIQNVTQDGKKLPIEKEGSAHFITLEKPQKKGASEEVVVAYGGIPKEAPNAPWDGGFTWKMDQNQKPFVATSCQGVGASIWWPNKDHMYDEPDSMAISIRIPQGLVAVANGRLKNREKHDDYTETFHWKVQNPINNYGVNLNIADYVHFGETYEGEQGTLDMDYWVLRENLEKAKVHFRDAKRTIQAMEHWFGPYPFYEDSYKLVEVPYLGMEHQSSVTYGNQYKMGYLGTDLSRTGWGKKFDFIIIHETAHEWFANNITYSDAADMWIHEGFTAYAEGLFLEYHYGKEAGAEYIVGTKKRIKNDRPIIGTYGVNHRGSGDMYYKGANILHTLRQLLENDDLWREILRDMNRDFRHQTVSSQEVENYWSKKTGIDLTAFFNQYLRDTRIPKLEVKKDGKSISFRYTDIVDDFDMPVQVYINSEESPRWLYPKTTWTTKELDAPVKDIRTDPNFLVKFSLVEE